MEEQLNKLAAELLHLALEWRRLYLQALGFKETLEYNDILFHVVNCSVFAHLAPIAYVDLAEEIEDGDVETAVAALYERLRPLLDCEHSWGPITPHAPKELICLDLSLSLESLIHVCAKCTAYCVKLPNTTLPHRGISSLELVRALGAK